MEAISREEFVCDGQGCPYKDGSHSPSCPAAYVPNVVRLLSRVDREAREAEQKRCVDALRDELESAKVDHRYYREIGHWCDTIVAMAYGRGRAVETISKALGVDGQLDLMKPLTEDEIAEMNKQRAIRSTIASEGE